MAEIIIPGPISGQSYGFRIKGDTPTVDEQMWIDNRVRQKESEFQTEYAARFGAPVETGEGEGIANYAGEFFKGIGRGGVNVLESALLGGAALLPEGAETRAREGIRSAAYALKPQTDIGLEDTVTGKFGEALGSFGAIGLTSLLPGGAFVAPALAVGAGAGEASERARAAGATAEERSKAALLGAPVGALELLPIKFIKVLGKPATGTIVNRLTRAAAEGGVEGAQEAATTIAQNLIEQGVYNPDKGTFSDTGEALGYGAGVGALVQGLLDLLPGRTGTPDVKPKQPALPPPTLALPAPQTTAGALPAPGTLDPLAARQTPNVVVPPTPAGAVRGGPGVNVPTLSLDAAATANSIGSDPQMLSAVEAIEAEGKATVGVIQKALGLSYPAANGIMRKLESVGAVSKYQQGKERALTLPFNVSAIREAQAASKVEEPTATSTRPAATSTAAPKKGSVRPANAAPAADSDAFAVETTLDALRASDGQLDKATMALGIKYPELRNRVRALESEGLVAFDKASGKMTFPEATKAEEPQAAPAAGNKPSKAELAKKQAELAKKQDELTKNEATIAKNKAKIAKNEAEMAKISDTLRAAEDQRRAAVAPAGVQNDTEGAAAQSQETGDGVQGGTSGVGEGAGADGRGDTTEDTAASGTGGLGASVQPSDNAGATGGTESGALSGPLRIERVDTTKLQGPDRPTRQLIPGTITPIDPLTLQPTGESYLESSDVYAPDRLLPGAKPTPVGTVFTGAPTEIQLRDAERQLEPIRAVREVAANSAAQSELNAEWDARMANEPKLASLIADYSTPDAVVKEDPTTSQDKQKILTLLRPGGFKKGKGGEAPAENAHAYFSLFKRPIDAIEFIVADVELKNQRFKDEAALEKEIGLLPGGDETINSVERAFFSGMTQRRAKQALTWVTANMSPQVQAKVRELRQKYKQAQAVKVPNKVSSSLASSTAIGGRSANLEERQRFEQELVAQKTEAVANKAAVSAAADELAAKRAGDAALAKAARERMERIGALTAVLKETKAPSAAAKAPRRNISAMTPVKQEELLLDAIFEARGTKAKPLTFNRPEEVLDLDLPLHPAVINALQNGNLEMALRALELYAPNARVKRIASVLAPYAKGTSVRVVEDLRDTDGTKLAGQYRRSLPGKPSEILLDGNVGLSIETLLHEMTHAATIKEMLNPASPLRKRMEKLFNEVKPKLSTSNGSRNVLEFMADAFSNPRFQSELSRIYPNGGRFSALWRIANDAMNLVRRLLGLQPRQLSNALDMTDQLVMRMLNFPTSPSDISTPQEAATILNRVAAVDGSFPARTKEFVQEFGDDASRVLDGASYGAKRAVLGFMNSQALADVASHYKISGAYDLQKAIDQFDAAAIKSDSEVDVVLDVGQRWVKNNPRLKPLFDRLVHRATVNQVDPSLPRNQAVKKYGADSDKMREYDAMQPDWAAIGNSGHDLYNNMRELYRKQYERLREALAGKIDFILQANPELAAEVKASIYTKFFDMNRIEPYFPLARKGDYWLEYSAFDPETNTTEQVRETYESPNARTRAAKELESMPGVVKGPDGKPVTSFYSTLDLVQQGRTPDSLFVRDTLAIIQSNLSNTGVDEATAKSIQQEITKLFVDALPETSFAKSLQRRKNTRGYMEDSLEALRVKGYSLGRQGVRYSYSNKIRAVTDGIVQQAKQTNDQNKIAVIAELAARSDFAVNPPNTAFERGVQNANRVAFTYTLGFNVSSSLVNLSSVPVVLYPYLSGRYGSKSAAVAIGNAYKIFANSGLKREIELPAEFEGKKTATVTAMPSIDNYFVLQEKRTVGADGKAVVTQEYVPRNDVAPELRPMLEELSTLVDIASKNGQLNRSIFYDSIGAENVGRARNFWDRFSAIGGAAFHQVERANRQVALVAAYNLELARLRNKPKDAERGLTPAEQRTRAAERAIYQATETGGGATLAAAPRFAQQGIGRIALMYKNFGLSLFYLQMKLIKQLTLGSNDPDFTPEDRKVAFKQLMGLQLSSFALAGISGVPLYGLVSTVADAFLGDDEEDADSLTRKYLGEGLYKGYLSEISGLDISSRIGLTGLLIRENRYNTDPSAEETLVANLGGPAWSTATQIGRGVSELYSAMTGNEGDMVRGIENMVPAAVRNFIKAGRYAAEGGDIETRRKDLITGDLGASDLLGQALGFTPTKATLAQDLNQLTVRISNNIVQKRSRLSKLYYIALREGDIEGAKEIMEDIRSFNEDVAQRFPEAVIDGEFLEDSLKSHQRTSKDMSTGVSLNPAVREGLEDMKAQYNQGFQLF